MPDPIIRVIDLTCAYGEHVVVHDVSFDVMPGEVFVILGGSGCGKSTVLRNMIGLIEPPVGHVLIDGENLVGAQGERRLSILRKFGVMYQMGALFGSITLLDNVRLPLEEFTNLSQDAMQTIALSKLSQVGLATSAWKMPSEVSGGMQKRAAIARAMALDPAILFLDEPSAGLDPVTSADLDALILRLARSLHVTFVIVTHELASIFAIADNVVMLDKVSRTVIARGDPRALRDNCKNTAVRSFFQRASTADTALGKKAPPGGA